MKQQPESQDLLERARQLEDRARGQSWGAFHGLYAALSMGIWGLMVLWVCGVGWLIFRAVRHMVRTGGPLVVRGRPTTWVTSVIYLAALAVMAVAGPVCLAFVRRMLRATLTASRDVLAERKNRDA